MIEAGVAVLRSQYFEEFSTWGTTAEEVLVEKIVAAALAAFCLSGLHPVPKTPS
jgi:hypothetical protein